MSKISPAPPCLETKENKKSNRQIIELNIKKQTQMKWLSIFTLFFLCLIYNGCSAIEKHAYFKPLDKNNNWNIEKNKKYEPYYNETTHYYNSCDSISAIQIRFTNTVKSLTVGPPLIPILPIPFIKNNKFYVYIFIKTQDDTDISTISKYIHISLNDSIIEPSSSSLYNDQRWLSSYKFSCDKQSTTNNVLTITYRYDIKPNKVKKIIISFDKELNDRFNSNYKDLVLKKRNRLRYCGFFYIAS
jgi:hypothetical protein